MKRKCVVILIVCLAQVRCHSAANLFLANDFCVNPYDRQVAEQLAKLGSPSDKVRAGAAESLGFLRAYRAADKLVVALQDESIEVRRQAAMALAWCGSREHVDKLLQALDDEDWVVRQSAWVSLTNLTAMEFAFDALTEPEHRKEQSKVWQNWWQSVTGDTIPGDIHALLKGDDPDGRLRAVRALGALGGRGASREIVNIVKPYREVEYPKVSSIEKNIVQCGLRSLGRLRDRESFEILLDFLNTEGWARYAADALSDFGDVRAVGPLIKAYPRFSRILRNRTKNPEL